jgi:hypothetical protein
MASACLGHQPGSCAAAPSKAGVHWPCHLLLQETQMQMHVKSIVCLAAMLIVGVPALAQSTQAPSEARAKASGNKSAVHPTQDKVLHDGLSPSVVNRSEKRKVEVPADMRSVPAEIKDDSNCHSKAGDA